MIFSLRIETGEPIELEIELRVCLHLISVVKNGCDPIRFESQRVDKPYEQVKNSLLCEFDDNSHVRWIRRAYESGREYEIEDDPIPF